MWHVQCQTDWCSCYFRGVLEPAVHRSSTWLEMRETKGFFAGVAASVEGLTNDAFPALQIGEPKVPGVGFRCAKMSHLIFN
jgi:hypothetical protein